MSILSKFPSYQNILTGFVGIIKRFPFSILCCLVGTIAAVNAVEFDNVTRHYALEKLIMTSVLGLPFYFLLAILSERRKWLFSKSIIINLAGLALLVFYYFSLPEKATDIDIHIIRFLLLELGLLALVAFLPFSGKDDLNGFWQFNKSMFLRFLISGLYAFVICIGLEIALVSIDYLFGMEIDEIRYMQLWMIIAGLFFPLVFFAGVPDDYDELKVSQAYPKGLKLFTQYVLLPLVFLYFAILITYEFKIIITWNWPKGMVSQLVLWYSVVGIFSLLLLYPLKEQTENRWIKVFMKWFFRALIPLVVMLILAILRRISDYGVTENRYFVFGMAVGLTIVMLYFIFSKAKDIRLIPIVICCLAFVATYGPQSAFSISLNNQKAILYDLLEEHELMLDNKIIKSEKEILLKDRKNISSKVSYLINYHGLEVISEWLDDTFIAQLDTVPNYSRKNKVTELMGFEFVYDWGDRDYLFFRLRAKDSHSYNIKAYDYFIEITGPNVHPVINLEEDSLKIDFEEENKLEITLLSEAYPENNMWVYNLEDTVRSLVKAGFTNTRNPVAENHLTFYQSTADFESMIIFKEINGNKISDSLSIKSINALLFLQKKNR